jgi:hypothetical protein
MICYMDRDFSHPGHVVANEQIVRIGARVPGAARASGTANRVVNTLCGNR